jgi:hypothetical protein
MTKTATNFLGIPIDGDINQGDKRVPQRPLSEFEPFIRVVLDDDTMTEFGWTQYTPYFNDGDPCVFTVHTPWFRTAAETSGTKEFDEDGDWDDTYNLEIYNHPSLGKRAGTWNPNKREYEYGTYEGPDEERFDRVSALNQAIESGAFNDVLLEAFGDHARVRVSRTGITVEYYEHD